MHTPRGSSSHRSRRAALLAAALWVFATGATAEERRISFDVKDADIHNVIRLLADAARVNIVVPSEVRGKVTLKLRDVRWKDALDVVLRSKGLGHERIGEVIYVDRLEALNRRQAEQLAAREARLQSASPVTVLIRVNYAKAADLVPIVQQLLTERGSVSVDVRTNTLIVTDVPDSVEVVRSRLKK